jgi:hypothetical protein
MTGRLILQWLSVGIPLLLGVGATLESALKLFQ